MFWDQSVQVYLNGSELHFSLGLGSSFVCETGDVCTDLI